MIGENHASKPLCHPLGWRNRSSIEFCLTTYWLQKHILLNIFSLATIKYPVYDKTLKSAIVYNLVYIGGGL
jgi:hypothetical protein